MAKNTPPAPGPVMASEARPSMPQNTPEATPENTPPPGGGRWRWDIALPGWVDADASAAADPQSPLE